MLNLIKFITVQNLTLVFSVITPLLLIYYKFNLDKKINKDNYKLKDLFELNNKTHDRLVEAEELIKTNKPLTDEIKRRLRYNSSRLKRYDNSVWRDVNSLISSWENTLFLKKQGNINDEEVSKSRSSLIELIEKIKSNIDKALN